MGRYEVTQGSTIVTASIRGERTPCCRGPGRTHTPLQMRVVLFCAVLLAVLCGPPPVLSQPGEETPEERNDVTPTNPVGEGQPAADQAIFAGLDAENVMEDAAAVEAEDRAEDAATAAVATADGATAANPPPRPLRPKAGRISECGRLACPRYGRLACPRYGRLACRRARAGPAVRARAQA